MAEKRSSVFADEWRRCLGEHYKYVMRKQDKATEETLMPILNRVGFTEDELRGLYLEATMRSDDVAEDFLPDAEKALPADDVAQADATFKVHPAECNCPSCMDVVLEEGHDDDGQPIEPEPDDDAPDDDRPQQQSLF